MPNLNGSIILAVRANTPANNLIYVTDYGDEFVTYTSSSSETPTGNQLVSASVRINANNYNAIYGASYTVQPPAIVLIPQIRY